MPPRVYLETSVVSALFDRREDPVSKAQRIQTEAWYDSEADQYALVASAMVLEELYAGTYDHQTEVLAFAEGLEMLSIDERVRGLARIYLAEAIPKNKLGDAIHVATASICSIEYLLTWNCKHLANPGRMSRVARINRRMGLSVPIVLTPTMLYEETL